MVSVVVVVLLLLPLLPLLLMANVSLGACLVGMGCSRRRRRRSRRRRSSSLDSGSIQSIVILMNLRRCGLGLGSRGLSLGGCLCLGLTRVQARRLGM